MVHLHTQYASGKWQSMILAEQLANIGSEVSRVAHWHEKGDDESKEKAVERALELIDLSISDQKNSMRLSELTRLREVLCDCFTGENIYNSTASMIEDYFLPFAIIVRR